MSKQTFYYVIAGVFLMVALLHLVRIIEGWEAVLGGVVIPMWVSWAAIVLAGYLSFRGYQFGRKL
mgnify:CR=1 FL=1